MEGKEQSSSDRLTVAYDERTGKDTYDFGKRAVLVNNLKESLKLGEIEPLPSPYTLEIEPTLFCNSDCDFCSYEEDRKTPVHLSRDSVFSTLESIKEGGTTKGIFWSGGGDPLVWPYIVEATKFASTFAHNMIQTNGIALDKYLTGKDFEGNLRSIDVLALSCHSHNRELYKTITRRDLFEVVTRNIRDVIEARNIFDLDMIISVKILVGDHNYLELPQIVEFYRNLGVNSVSIRELQNYNYGGDGPRRKSVELSKDQRTAMSENILTSGTNDKTLLSFANRDTSKANISDNTKTSHCFNATDGHFACIDARGNVVLGNPEIGNSDMTIGNINLQKWRNIWRSQRHYEVIRKMDYEQSTNSCAKGLCRHVKANIGVENYIKGGKKDFVSSEETTTLDSYL